MATLEFKRGQTFLLYAALTDANSNAVDVPVANIAAQVRRQSNNALLANLEVATTSTTGTYLLSCNRATTANWPVANAIIDVHANLGTYEGLSNTAVIKIANNVTEVS